MVEFAVQAGAETITAAPAPVSDPAPDLSEVGDLSEYDVLSADDCPF